MAKKLNQVLIGLVALSIISCLFALYSYVRGSGFEKKYKNLLRESAKLKQSNDELAMRVSDLDSRKRALDDKVKQLKGEVDGIAVERDDLAQKFEILSQEKNSLLERLETLSKMRDQMQQQKSVGVMADVPDREVSDTTPDASQDEYWANLIKDKTQLKLQLEELMTRVQDLQTERNETEKKRAELEIDLNKLSQENKDLTRKLEYTKKVVDDLSSQLVTEKKDAQAIRRQIDTLKEENYVLSNQLKRNITAKLSIEKKISELEGENADLKKRLDRTDNVLEDRITDLVDIKKEIDVSMSELGSEFQSVQLPPIVVKSDTEGSPMQKRTVSSTPVVSVDTIDVGALQAKIVSVDEENNFVIIDKGRNQGVVINKVLGVYQDNKRIATIEVIKLRDNISACDIRQASSPILVGSSVR